MNVVVSVMVCSRDEDRRVVKKLKNGKLHSLIHRAFYFMHFKQLTTTFATNLESPNMHVLH